ncbi:MAG: laccase domain-containing protein, partial [Campylobacter sp.]|uniref:laccase domain-containing protein n=1 Tax=Campylobacter sp. TaxID=205 RepID=UPI001B560BA2
MLVSIDDERLIAGFTTKFGGVSSKEYESLNLAMHVGDNASNVEKNRQILCQKIGANRLIFMDQIHSDKVEALNDINQILDPCDSIFTGISKVGLCVMVADCSPVLLYDKRLNLIAAIHAG